MNTTPQLPQSQRNTLHGSVLVALDGSPAANMALPIARVFARQLGARLEILHMVPEALDKEAARTILPLARKELKDAEIHVHVGTPVEGILQMAAEPDIRLVVLTTHGRVIETGHRLGRVAEAVVANTNKPVLLVRPEAVVGRERTPARIGRMLVPLDGTLITFGSLRPAIDLANRLHTAVDLLYVVSPGQPVPVEPGSIHVPMYVDQPQHEWPEWSHEATMRLVSQTGCPNTVRARAYLGYGDIAAEVIRFANQHDDDIIVLVRRSHFEAGRARVLRRVLKHTPCPIFLVAARSSDSDTG